MTRDQLLEERCELLRLRREMRPAGMSRAALKRSKLLRKSLRRGDWSIGRYAWELANVVALNPPIAAKGSQGFWDWDAPAEVLEAIA